jgi:hypothetical protein
MCLSHFLRNKHTQVEIKKTINKQKSLFSSITNFYKK